MHDYRFKQMEYTLPEEYLDETELERQRKIHDSLITMGLKLISDSYLVPMQQRCVEAGLEFEPRMMDGKHPTEIVADMNANDYDLVVIGALGLGRVRDSSSARCASAWRGARTRTSDREAVYAASGRKRIVPVVKTATARPRRRSASATPSSSASTARRSRSAPS